MKGRGEGEGMRNGRRGGKLEGKRGEKEGRVGTWRRGKRSRAEEEKGRGEGRS